MIKLKKLNTADYATSSEFFRSADFKAMTKDYFNYVYTACLDYIDTGDVNILNSVLVAAKYAQRVRVTKQLVQLVAAHRINGKGKYSGKANVKRLKLVRSKVAEVKDKQETIINRDTEKKEKTATTFNVDQTQTRAVNAIASLLAHGIDVDFAELAKLANEQKGNVKTKTVPDTTAPVVADFEPEF